MKVALFIPVLGFGGAEKVMLTLANGLAEYGHDVDLVLVQKKGALISDVSENVSIIDLNARKTFFSLFKLIRYLRHTRPDILLSALDNANIISSLALAFSFVKTKHIPTLHTNLKRSYQSTRSFVQKINPFLLKGVFKRADRIVAVSNGTAKHCAQFLNIPLEKIEVIYNPVLGTNIHAAAKASLSHPWFLKKDRPVIVAAGRLFEAKDYPTMLQGFAGLIKEMPARLLIAGDGKEPLKKELASLAEHLQIKDDIEFLGFTENPYYYMKKADLFVLSSKWEGFGNVLAEALYLGTPVVSSHCESGPEEILNNGEFGTLFPVGDAEKLTEAMKKQLTDPIKINQIKLKEHLHKMSREYSVKHYEMLLKRELGEKSETSFGHYPDS
ncbi:glycosyltransferase [Metabacillus idriensis]|uniref:glycosyltransferase n=1 Tax=Metabacillus idriensis TaxID=324768 RepID=UPI00174D878A|nr:glycosyltransferase [Metabacillus idriensis]